MIVGRGWEFVFKWGQGFGFADKKSSSDARWWWVHSNMSVLNTTEHEKMVKLLYFITIKYTRKIPRRQRVVF